MRASAAIDHAAPGAQGDRMLLAALWTAVVLELFGVVLLGHGGTFVGFGLSALTKGETMTTELRWYARCWGPWFMLGGALFGAAPCPLRSTCEH
ncbi:hypothetical protein [Salinispora oceanensis]|uniref:hypothetical protein n=1 Tax=Salinispora oceanensis TaxID=1050199 RepID=UPI0003A73BFC|nr:hypothetical protein [Salinispora oceanensis]